jgi:hypothetical protein
MQLLKKSFVFIGISVMAIMGVTGTNSCVHQPYVVPDSLITPDTSICFERDILPVFQSNCAMSGCHNAGSAEDGYVLDNYANIVRKGITPGNAAGSKIWKSIAIETGDDRMPRNAAPLPAATQDLIKRWINAGAKNGGSCTTACDTNAYAYSTTIAPMMQTYCTGCHSSASSAGGSLMDHASVKNAAVNGNLINCVSHTTGYSAMPQGGSKLSDCKITQIKKWVAAGALNN